ncbi:MAG TPA: arylsulfatase [Acidimicrobiales bacterium]|nr:arylsulfatase [Acidimicrobiales bacterium]
MSIGRYATESTPSFPVLPRPPAGAPNVVVIVLDDTGFAQLGCFGSDIVTPNIDRLAAGGVRYNRFHVTSLCSPTRASLMTGQNHHRVGMGFLTDIPLGYPGYTGRIPADVPTLPGLLRDSGYNTFAIGKWHLAPRWEQSASGPFTRWPLGLGFERYYGFIGPDSNHWTPHLTQDNTFVEPPARPEDGYHLTEDLADRAIRMVLDQQQATPDKPFFLYFATGAMHAPHHAPRDWIDRYRGHFDDGWEAWRQATFERQVAAGIVPGNTTLLDRPPWVQDWSALSADERRLFARMMEVFAGFLSHTDAQIGRLLDFLASIDALDNTLVLLFSDNGTSAEGGPVGSLNEHRFTHDMVDDVADTLAHIDDLGGFRAYNHYPWGWAWAGNTPLRLWKRYSWLGGVRTPLIVRAPGGGNGEIRDEFCHVNDLLPTICDAVGIERPGDLDGTPLGTEHRMQYFEMLGSRSMYVDGWKATTDHVGRQITVEREHVEGSKEFATDRWELFNLSDDFAEAHDLSETYPDKVRELESLWWSEAGRNQVLPLDDSFVMRATALEPRPYPPGYRTTYRPGGNFIAEDFLPPLGLGFDVIADIDAVGDGVLVALGDWNNGWAVYVLDGKPVVAFSLFSKLDRLEGPALPAGARELRMSFRPERGKPGSVTIAVDGDVVAEGELSGHLPFRWQIGGGGLHVGHDTGFPVCDDYVTPFPFTGTLTAVHIEVPILAPPPAADEVASAIHRE